MAANIAKHGYRAANQTVGDVLPSTSSIRIATAIPSLELQAALALARLQARASDSVRQMAISLVTPTPVTIQARPLSSNALEQAVGLADEVGSCRKDARRESENSVNA